jgi:drug/metabolite transporter (DMT)-like permease
VPAVLFGVLAALANAAQALISKELTTRAPARQLIGVLYVGNCLVLLPFAPFVEWSWSAPIIVLHLASVGLMVLTAISVWDLLDRGAASATTTATAMSPLPAAIVASVVLPAVVQPLHVVAAIIVVAGVLYALADAFPSLDRWGRTWRILGAAIGSGALTVVTRLLGDEGVGLVETYVVRTALAALVCIALFPPRDVRGSDIPRLLGRSVVVTTYFVFLILGAQAGSPVVVQTLVATTPLLVLGVEALRRGSAPPVRAMVAAAVVVVGVALILVA